MGLFKKKDPVEPARVEPSADVQAAADAELIAVISAAIAAYEGEMGATSNLIIRKINRTAGVIPAWGVAGNREQIDTRRM